jgi:aryl-alcohol dehydrogenase-like predicted oxidoreductase
MRHRVLGRTGIQVSEIGYGGWGIGGGWGPKDDEEAMRALRKALDLGVSFFDSALGYGGGHSEQLIWQAVKGMRERSVCSLRRWSTTWASSSACPLRRGCSRAK